MILEISKQDLTLYYSKAREQYDQCINNKDNAFLEKEISVPLDTIELKDAEVKYVFSQENTEEYMLEITIMLWDKSSQLIGKYVYVEDDKGNGVDDSLVWF